MNSTRRGFFATLAALPAVVMGWREVAKPSEAIALKVNASFGTVAESMRGYIDALNRFRETARPIRYASWNVRPDGSTEKFSSGVEIGSVKFEDPS